METAQQNTSAAGITPDELLASLNKAKSAGTAGLTPDQLLQSLAAQAAHDAGTKRIPPVDPMAMQFAEQHKTVPRTMTRGAVSGLGTLAFYAAPGVRNVTLPLSVGAAVGGGLAEYALGEGGPLVSSVVEPTEKHFGPEVLTALATQKAEQGNKPPSGWQRVGNIALSALEVAALPEQKISESVFSKPEEEAAARKAQSEVGEFSPVWQEIGRRARVVQAYRDASTREERQAIIDAHPDLGGKSPENVAIYANAMARSELNDAMENLPWGAGTQAYTSMMNPVGTSAKEKIAKVLLANTAKGSAAFGASLWGRGQEWDSQTSTGVGQLGAGAVDLASGGVRGLIGLGRRLAGAGDDFSKSAKAHGENIAEVIERTPDLPADAKQQAAAQFAPGTSYSGSEARLAEVAGDTWLRASPGQRNELERAVQDSAATVLDVLSPKVRKGAMVAGDSAAPLPDELAGQTARAATEQAGANRNLPELQNILSGEKSALAAQRKTLDAEYADLDKILLETPPSAAEGGWKKWSDVRDILADFVKKYGGHAEHDMAGLIRQAQAKAESLVPPAQMAKWKDWHSGYQNAITKAANDLKKANKNLGRNAARQQAINSPDVADHVRDHPEPELLFPPSVLEDLRSRMGFAMDRNITSASGRAANTAALGDARKGLDEALQQILGEDNFSKLQAVRGRWAAHRGLQKAEGADMFLSRRGAYSKHDADSPIRLRNFLRTGKDSSSRENLRRRFVNLARAAVAGGNARPPLNDPGTATSVQPSDCFAEACHAARRSPPPFPSPMPWPRSAALRKPTNLRNTASGETKTETPGPGTRSLLPLKAASGRDCGHALRKRHPTLGGALAESRRSGG